jgi:hypothetical protein
MSVPIPLDVYSLPSLEGAAVPLSTYEPRRFWSGATYNAPRVLHLGSGYSTVPIWPSWPFASGGAVRLDAPFAVTLDPRGTRWSDFEPAASISIPGNDYHVYIPGGNWAIDNPIRSAADTAWENLPRASTLPVWAEVAAQRLNMLAAVPVESHGGRPLNLEDVEDALVFLSRVMTDVTPAPWIGRLSSGGIQLSWRSTGGDVEVEAVFDRARNERTVIVATSDDERELPVDEAYSLFAQVAGRLPRRELASP